MNNLSRREIEGIIEGALELDWSVTTDAQERRPLVVGSLVQGAPASELEILNLASARFGYRHVRFDLDHASAMSTEDIVAKAHMIGTCVDAVVSSIVDESTFGSGKALLEMLANAVQVPLVSIMDDIYAPQPALGVLSAIWRELGSLQGRKIGVAWGYGTRFTLPNLAHSLITLGAKLGAHIAVASPPEFSLMRRIIRDAEHLTEENNSSFDETNEFDIPSLEADVVVGLNWTCLDDFSYPEKVADKAREYRDWHFTEECLGSTSLFITEPPVQTGLLASMNLVKSRKNLTGTWLARRIQVLAQSLRYVRQQGNQKSPARII